jgi:AICAR transformylase/IMP cyclohydrolase PurH
VDFTGDKRRKVTGTSEGREMEIELKYGCNPRQVPAWLTIPGTSGFRVLNG